MKENFNLDINQDAKTNGEKELPNSTNCAVQKNEDGYKRCSPCADKLCFDIFGSKYCEYHYRKLNQQRGETMEENFNSDLNQDARIDKDQLHIECMEITEKYKQHLLMLSTAKKELDITKDHFTKTKANLELDLREKSPEELGVKKIIESTIKALIEGDPDLLAQKKIIRNREEKVRKITAVVNALEMKGNMLSNLIVLWEKQYPNWDHVGYNQTQDSIRKNLKEKGGK